MVTADIHQIGDDDERSLSLGVEGGIRVSESSHLALRLGYSEPLSGWDLFSQGFSWEQGVYAAGATLNLFAIRLDAVIQTGFDNIMALLDPTHGGVGEESIRGNISCTIRM